MWIIDKAKMSGKGIIGVVDELRKAEEGGAAERAKLRRALWEKEKVIQYLLRRRSLTSGSPEMGQGDAMCERLGYRPWKNPTL